MAFAESVKLTVKRKAHFSCCLCHKIGVEVHHIQPQAEGGPDSEDNAAPLCPSCHDDYGANPGKRKFIRETRDFWFDICSKRYASDADRIAEISNRIDQLVGFQGFLEQRLIEGAGPLGLYRSERQILEELEVLFDKVWYNRHLNMLIRVESGEEQIAPEILRLALKAAQQKRDEYGEENLGPWDDFEWGMLNGKMSALRWVMGDEWDFLDT